MSSSRTITVEVRSVPGRHVVVERAIVPGMANEHIGPVVGAIYPRLAATLDAAGIEGFGPAVAVYESDEAADGSALRIIAGFVVPDAVTEVPGAEVAELPSIERAAVTVHRGDVTGLGGTWMALHAWIGENGLRPDGVGREIYWTPGDRPQSEWVTDVVQPVTDA